MAKSGRPALSSKPLKQMTIKSHLELAELASQVYKSSEYETNGVEFSLVDNVFVFRGTDEITDWITNARVLPWYVKGLGWCHSGFVKTADDICEKALALVLREGVNWKELQFTGHSLGGAIAQLVAAMFVKQDLIIHECVAFAPPCVGRVKPLSLIPNTAYRFGNDIVPMVPLLLRRPTELIPLGKPSSRFWNAADHGMENYRKALISAQI